MPLLVVYHWHAYCLAPKESRKLPSCSQVATLEARQYGLVSCPIMEQLGSACSGLFKRQHRQESSETTLFASSSLLQGCKFCGWNWEPFVHFTHWKQHSTATVHAARTTHRHAAERSSELSFRAAEAKISTWRTARADWQRAPTTIPRRHRLSLSTCGSKSFGLWVMLYIFRNLDF